MLDNLKIFHYFMSFIHWYVIGCVQGSYAYGKPTKVMEFYYSSKGIEIKTTACLDILNFKIISKCIIIYYLS